jgi:NitT/TauT family transport system substrate-binding protein
MNRRSMLAAAAAALVPVRGVAQPALTPLAASPNTAADQVVFYYAQQSGIFARAGLDVTAVPATSGSGSLLAVVGGTANVGFSNTLSLAVAHSKGIPIVSVAPGGLYDTTAPIVRALVNADAPIHTARDLVGRTIAVAGLHDLLSLGAEAWLGQGGVTPDQVRFLEMPASAMLAALQSRRVDAMVVYQPFDVAAIAAGARVLAKPYDAIALMFQAGIWFASSTWADAHRDATLRFAAAMHESAVYVNAHFDELLPMVTAFTRIDVDTLRKTPHPRFPPALSAALIQPVIDTAAKYHELPAAFRAQEMIFA